MPRIARRCCGFVVLCCLASGAPARAQEYPVYFAPDIPVRGVASFDMMPWQIILYIPATSAYGVIHSVPGQPFLDGIFKLPGAPDSFLFSVAVPSRLGGVFTPPAYADPRDIVKYDGPTGTYSQFFCGAEVGFIRAGANVDALYLDGGEAGSLVLSFDIPLTIPLIIAGARTEVLLYPADLVRFTRTGSACDAWKLANPPLVFDASAAGVPPGVNVRGADVVFGDLALTFDVPIRIGSDTYVPGDIVRWNGSSLSRLEHLASWPTRAGPMGTSILSDLGDVGPIALAQVPGGKLRVQWLWAAGCPGDGFGFGLYEGTIGSWYSHTPIQCATSVGSEPFSLDFTPSSGNRYYLIVPFYPRVEGSYGRRTAAQQERPPGITRCAPTQQTLNLCP